MAKILASANGRVYVAVHKRDLEASLSVRASSRDHAKEKLVAHFATTPNPLNLNQISARYTIIFPTPIL